MRVNFLFLLLAHQFAVAHSSHVVTAGKIKCESTEFMAKLLGGFYYPFGCNVGLPLVDVDDVAAAHVLAMVTPEAVGRFIVCSTSMLLSNYVDLLRPGCPQPCRLPYLWLPFWLLWFLTTFRQAVSVPRNESSGFGVLPPAVPVAAVLAHLVPHNLQASSLCLLLTTLVYLSCRLPYLWLLFWLIWFLTTFRQAVSVHR